jgi:hypothetical protein
MAIWQQEIWEAVALHYFGLTIVCLMGGKEPREYSSRADHFLDSLDHFMPGCGLKMIGPPNWHFCGSNCHPSLGRYFQFFVDSYYAQSMRLDGRAGSHGTEIGLLWSSWQLRHQQMVRNLAEGWAWAYLHASGSAPHFFRRDRFKTLGTKDYSIVFLWIIKMYSNFNGPL